MKYGIFLFIFIVFVLGAGCKSHKNAVRTVEIASTTDAAIRKTDTARTAVEYEKSEVIKDSLRETTERETIYLDTLGRVRTIVKESVRKEAGQRRIYRGQGSAVSVSGKTDSVITTETARALTEEKTDIKTDSRPVQGGEWVWVIAGIGLLLIAIFGFIRHKL